MITAEDVISQLRSLPPAEAGKVIDWVHAHEVCEESPEFIAALEEGIRAADEGRVSSYTKEEFTKKINKWIYGSR